MSYERLLPLQVTVLLAAKSCMHAYWNVAYEHYFSPSLSLPPWASPFSLSILSTLLILRLLVLLPGKVVARPLPLCRASSMSI